jgi:hypothetical protein
LEAIDDAHQYQKDISRDFPFCGQGAVIVCPTINKVVARSFSEWSTILKENENDVDVGTLLLKNPLNSPVLFAIQGVSRIERLSALGHGMDSESFRKGQYLCTG